MSCIEREVNPVFVGRNFLLLPLSPSQGVKTLADADNETNRSERKAPTPVVGAKRGKARALGFPFISDWLKMSCDVFQPIIKRRYSESTFLCVAFDS